MSLSVSNDAQRLRIESRGNAVFFVMRLSTNCVNVTQKYTHLDISDTIFSVVSLVNSEKWDIIYLRLDFFFRNLNTEFPDTQVYCRIYMCVYSCLQTRSSLKGGIIARTGAA